MNPSDLEGLMEQAREMQTRLADLQRALASRRVEGSAGGGMVKAVATGELRIVELQFEPSLLEGGDRQMIQDLAASAVNAALANAQRMVQEEFQRASIGIQLPGAAAGPSEPS